MFYTQRMVDQTEIKDQLVAAVEDADYPINGPMELLPALPNGPATRVESGDFSITAMELTTKVPQGVLEFPYETPEAFAEDVVEEMNERDII